MKKILEFLAGDGAFFYEEEGFRIVDSEYIPTFGGTGSLVLSNGAVDLRLHLDRDRLMLDFRATSHKSRLAWFSLDVVRQLLTGEPDKGFLEGENISFVKRHIKEVMMRLDKASLASTEAALRQLEKDRAKRLFG